MNQPEMEQAVWRYSDTQSARKVKNDGYCARESPLWPTVKQLGKYSISQNTRVVTCKDGTKTIVQWGKETCAEPEVFAASDVSQSTIDLTKYWYQVATEAWGNYGPVEIYIVGSDMEAAKALEEDYCNNHKGLDANWNETWECANENYQIFTRYVTDGNAGVSTFKRTYLDYDFLALTMSAKYPGPEEEDYKPVVLHEYFHVYQHAHISDECGSDSRESCGRDDKLGGKNKPWLTEGGAEFMAQYLYSRQPGVEKGYLKERMKWKLEGSLDSYKAQSKRLEELTYDDKGYAYDIGAWFVAYLIHQGGEQKFVVDFYEVLDGLGFEDAFLTTFGKTRRDYVDEFNEFLNRPQSELLQIFDENGLIVLDPASSNDGGGVNDQALAVPDMKILTKHPKECMNTVFDKFINIFGVIVVAPEEAPSDLFLHTANVLAQYIDNDEDGIPDDPTVLAHLVNNNFVVPVWSSSDRIDFWEQARGTDCEDYTSMAASMYYDEDEWAIGGINRTGTWDGNLEEVWHVVSIGWYAAYPEYFGDGTSDTNEVTPSKLTDAMDAARGGQFVPTPTEYPENAWYAYTDQSCDYGCQVHEYFYWILMSNLGALEPTITSKCEQSEHEWNVCTKAQLKQTDVMAFNLLNDNDFALPQIIPDGTYRLDRNSEGGSQSDAVALPSGEVGTIGLDLDTTFGDQGIRQTPMNPSVGDKIEVEVFITEGASGQGVFLVEFAWVPTELKYLKFATRDVFGGAITLETAGDGTMTLSNVILGANASKDGGSAGVVAFEVAETFSGSTTITLTSAKLGTNALVIGSGASYVVIGGQTETVLTPPQASDFDGDGTVGFGDFLIFANGFGITSDDSDFNSTLDLDRSGDVGFGDFLAFASVFGQNT
jgi:hypothetical protein